MGIGGRRMQKKDYIAAITLMGGSATIWVEGEGRRTPEPGDTHGTFWVQGERRRTRLDHDGRLRHDASPDTQGVVSPQRARYARARQHAGSREPAEGNARQSKATRTVRLGFRASRHDASPDSQGYTGGGETRLDHDGRLRHDASRGEAEHVPLLHLRVCVPLMPPSITCACRRV
jgi:hypothetical protein